MGFANRLVKVGQGLWAMAIGKPACDWSAAVNHGEADGDSHTGSYIATLNAAVKRKEYPATVLPNQWS